MICCSAGKLTFGFEIKEYVVVLQWYDANISLPGCDKNMPGVIIAMARLNRPSLMVYGGTIKPGVSTTTGKPIDVVSAFQSYGKSSPSHTFHLPVMSAFHSCGEPVSFTCFVLVCFKAMGSHP